MGYEWLLIVLCECWEEIEGVEGGVGGMRVWESCGGVFEEGYEG